MQCEVKNILNTDLVLGKADSWTSSAWQGFRLAILYAPTTFVAMVVLPILSLFIIIWEILSGFILWMFYSLIVLGCGLAGMIKVLPKNNSQS